MTKNFLVVLQFKHPLKKNIIEQGEGSYEEEEAEQEQVEEDSDTEVTYVPEEEKRKGSYDSLNDSMDFSLTQKAKKQNDDFTFDDPLRKKSYSQVYLTQHDSNGSTQEKSRT